MYDIYLLMHFQSVNYYKSLQVKKTLCSNLLHLQVSATIELNKHSLDNTLHEDYIQVHSTEKMQNITYSLKVITFWHFQNAWQNVNMMN